MLNSKIFWSQLLPWASKPKELFNLSLNLVKFVLNSEIFRSQLLTCASKSKTCCKYRGHSSPHLQVPSFIKYSLTSSTDFNSVPLGLKSEKKNYSKTTQQKPIRHTMTYFVNLKGLHRLGWFLVSAARFGNLSQFGLLLTRFSYF